MSIRAVGTAPCWQIMRDGQPLYEETIPHYGNEARARDEMARYLAELDVEDWPDGLPELTPVESFPKPCVEVICDEDGCSCEFDLTGDGATHMDPENPDEWVEECEWATSEDGRHWCPSHHPAPCEGCGDTPTPGSLNADDLCVACAPAAGVGGLSAEGGQTQ